MIQFRVEVHFGALGRLPIGQPFPALEDAVGFARAVHAETQEAVEVTRIRDANPLALRVLWRITPGIPYEQWSNEGEWSGAEG